VCFEEDEEVRFESDKFVFKRGRQRFVRVLHVVVKGLSLVVPGEGVRTSVVGIRRGPFVIGGKEHEKGVAFKGRERQLKTRLV